MRSRRTSIALACALSLTLCGCENFGGILRGGEDSDSIPLARALDRQIMELDLLSTVPYQDRIDIYTSIELDFASEPSDSNQLRLALAKSVEGHPNTDLSAAFNELQQLLQAPNTLSPTQLHLANIVSRRVDDSLSVNSDLNELREKLATFESTDNAKNTEAERRIRDIRARLKAAEDNNARLEEELAQAQRQLDAIMSIETSSDPGH